MVNNINNSVRTVSQASHPERSNLEKLTGRYNDFPPGWHEVTEEELAKSQVVYGNIIHVEYRQMYDRSKGFNSPMTTGRLFHTDNGLGFGIVSQAHKGTVQFFMWDAIEKLKKEFEALPVIEDSTWKGAGGIPRRGINDFARTIKFERALTPQEMDIVTMYLERDNCPGWTGVRWRKSSMDVIGSEETAYTFTTTWDSSD